MRGGTLIYDRNLNSVTFTPWMITGNGDIFAQHQVFDELVEVVPHSPDPQPALADSWTISPDRLVYTFHLRPGVKFSNGAPVTPADVKYSLDGFADPKVNTLNASVVGATIKRVSVVDSSHVRVTLSKATPALLNYLAMWVGAIVPEKLVKQMGATKFGQHPVGTGPFVVSSFTPGNPTLVLERNPRYWQPGQPYLDRVIYHYVPEDNTRTLNVQSGAADVADSVPFSQASRLKSSPGVALVTQNYADEDTMMINEAKAPLNKVAVRQALAYATPLSAIVRVAFNGYAQIAADATMPTKYLDPAIHPYPYDLAKARKLLAQAGVPHGFTVKLLTFSGDSVGKQVSTILQASWAKIGIHLIVQQEDSGAATTAWTTANYELFDPAPQANSSDTTVDDEFAAYMGAEAAPPFPYIGWHDAEAKRVVLHAISTSDEAQRQRDFTRYQQILREQQPMLNLGYPQNLFLVRPRVHNFVTTDMGWPLLGDAWLSH